AATLARALNAGNALRTTCRRGPVAHLSGADMRRRVRGAHPPCVLRPLLSPHLDGGFDLACVNHAPMEVPTAVADVPPHRADVWLAVQSPIVPQQAIAAE
ncbi:hypothetical protein VM98_39255, partial [Streptomyces rubellomurinus subsp. indigoferus]